VGFATTEIAHDQQPALQVAGILAGTVESQLERIAVGFTQPDAPLRFESFKGQTTQVIEVAERKKALAYLLRDVDLATGADLELAKVGVFERQIPAQVSGTSAMGAIRVTQAVSVR
jgi:hypothetical protein